MALSTDSWEAPEENIAHPKTSPPPPPWPLLLMELPAFPFPRPRSRTRPPPAPHGHASRCLHFAHSSPNSTSSPRPSLTEWTFAARFWATRSQWQFLALVTASTFPCRCFRIPDTDGGPGKPPSRRPAALAPGSWTLQAAGAAVEAAAAPRGRLAFDGRGLAFPASPFPPASQDTREFHPLPLCLLVSRALSRLPGAPETHPSRLLGQ